MVKSVQNNCQRITLTAAGGLEKTAVYLWMPDKRPVAVVQILHGMREHMGRYEDFAGFLCAQGYAVCGHDHMGHGKSGDGEAAFGFFGEKDGAKKLVLDSHRVTRFLQQRFPDTPAFLLGHSMGSLIGRIYILHYPRDIAGFLCLGSSGEPPLMRMSMARTLAEAMIRLHGAKGEGWALHRLSFSSYHKRFSQEDSRMAWLSRDPQVVEKFEWDALIRPVFTNSGYRDLYDLLVAASGKGWAGRVDKNLPILIASGSEDPVGDYGKGPVQIYERLKMAGALDVECKLYDGARHELLNEINREEVYYDLHTWMQRRINGGSRQEEPGR